MRDTRTIPEISIDLLNELGTLVRTEADLARSETSGKITHVAVGLGLIVGGAVLMTPAVVILLQAAVNALQDSDIFAPWSAALVVGGAAFVVGLVLLAAGASRLKAKRLVPHKTIHQLQRDASVAKNQMRNQHDFIQRAP